MNLRIGAVVKHAQIHIFALFLFQFWWIYPKWDKNEASGRLYEIPNLSVPAYIQTPFPCLEDKIIGVHANTVLQSIKASCW